MYVLAESEFQIPMPLFTFGVKNPTLNLYADRNLTYIIGCIAAKFSE